jgi:hypothetical protein
MAKKVRANNIQMLVIDTENKFVSTGGDWPGCLLLQASSCHCLHIVQCAPCTCLAPPSCEFVCFCLLAGLLRKQF